MRFSFILASLVVFVQTASLAHATVFGDASHDHNGIVCDLDTVVAENEAVLPPPVYTPPPQITCTRQLVPVEITHVWVRPPGRAPPPRGPPTINQ